MQAQALKLWTPDEDNLLREAVRQHGAQRWDLIASAVPNHSEASCSARWEELQSRRALARQPWTQHEDEMLSSIVEREGASQWTVVASLLPGRNAKQCRERWHHQLDPSIKREAWSADEDTLLVTLQRKFGNAWSRMVAYLPGRTDNAIKNRWHSAQLRRRRRASNWHSDVENTVENTSREAITQQVPASSTSAIQTYSSAVSSVAGEEEHSSCAWNVVDDVDLVWAELAEILLDETE
ncbi:Myb-like protein [Phytophthora cinnamomi]|uniref:Myb-like protein n=1 Tax=Phytophthora cinnamomi TaxID=4785 RepID=UPI003559E109|nr:Myb-like protein [Phytophthora cinnamomi]